MEEKQKNMSTAVHITQPLGKGNCKKPLDVESILGTPIKINADSKIYLSSAQHMYIAIVSEFPSILIKSVINYRIDFYNTIVLWNWTRLYFLSEQKTKTKLLTN